MTGKSKNGSKARLTTTKRDVEKSKAAEELREEAIPLPPDIIEKLPEEARVSLQAAFSMMRISGVSPSSPLLQKLNAEHLTTIISSIDKENERQYNFSRSSRWFKLGYTGIAIGLFIFLTLMFGKSDQSLYLGIIQVLIALGGGIGFGIGYKRRGK